MNMRFRPVTLPDLCIGNATPFSAGAPGMPLDTGVFVNSGHQCLCVGSPLLNSSSWTYGTLADTPANTTLTDFSPGTQFIKASPDVIYVPAPRATATVSLLRSATAGAIQDADGTIWFSHLEDSLRSWRDNVAKESQRNNVAGASQRHFWSALNVLVAGDAASPSLTGVSLKGLSLPDTLFDIDAVRSEYELSRRSIRAILDELLGQLANLDEVHNTAEIVALVRETFARGVLARAKWRSKSKLSAGSTAAASTHDWVLDFTIHTGNSPPFPAAAAHPRSAVVGGALVTTTVSPEVGYETVRRRKNTRNLRNTVLQRSARACFGRSTPNRPSLGGCLQLAGRRSPGSDSALAQCA